MHVHVIIATGPDGACNATSPDLPGLHVPGEDPDDCTRNLIGAFWEYLAQQNAAFESAQDIRLTVTYDPPGPEPWEILLPAHEHRRR